MSGFSKLRSTFIILTLFLFTITGCEQGKEKDDTVPIAKNENKQNVDQELTKKGAYLVNSIGYADCHSPKKMGERGPEIISELSLSGYSTSQKLPAYDQEAISNGWMLMNADLTAAVGLGEFLMLQI